MKPTITVVKLGGNCMDDPQLLNSFLVSFAKLQGPKLLIHGGGKLATELGARLKIPMEIIEGRRVTCSETLKVVTMTYAGLINKELVSKLQQLGCNAAGISGADGNLIRSQKRKPEPIDYGFVGDPACVDITLLDTLLQAHFVPVISPITADQSGQLLNTNADTVASYIASALTKSYDVHLLFAFDKNGVLKDANDNHSIIPELTRVMCDQMKAENRIAGGMNPKLQAGFAALNGNVKRVTIQHLSKLESNTALTTLVL